jgi:signal transduction histidine kinase
MNLDLWQIEQEQMVAEYKELRDAGQISDSEYEELVEDLLDVARIEEDLELEQNKIRVQKAIDAIRVVAGLL